MLTGNEHYVILKLITGEQVMAVLEHETQDSVIINFPMLLRLFPIINDQSSHEHVTATPYCKFAADSNLTIFKQNILFIKKLHHVLIPHYMHLVNEAENQVLVRKDREGNVSRSEELTWDDETREEVEQLSNDEIKKRIAMLEAIAGLKTKEEKEEEESNYRYFIEGNDTSH